MAVPPPTSASAFWRTTLGTRTFRWGVALFCLLGGTALLGPSLVPDGPVDVVYRPDGAVLALSPPSPRHPLGTTYDGYDVLSQFVHGARVSFGVGIVSALVIVVIGTNVGLVAGYRGGWVDDVLMRITDVAFSLPLIPFAVVLMAINGPSVANITLAICLLLWRTISRVIRAAVISVKVKPFVVAARVCGAGHVRVMYRHVLPNVLPLSLIYCSFGTAWSIISEASISFVGFGDPRVVSWGRMLNEAFATGSIGEAWWWILPPVVGIVGLVVGAFLIGRALETALGTAGAEERGAAPPAWTEA